MTNLYFTDTTVYKRVDGIDSTLRQISKENYESENIVDQTIALLPAVNQVLVNTAGNYLLCMDMSVATAKVTLYVDGFSIPVYDLFQSIVSGTTISITSDTAVSVGVTLIKII